MNPDLVPIITFVGKSGTGKTTLLEQLIPMLKARGLRLAVLKHDAHHFEMDKPGKDTYRFTAAGADVVTISNAEKFAMIEQPPEELSLRDIISRLPQVDLVLTEGYKRAATLKSRFTGPSSTAPCWPIPTNCWPILTDEPVDSPAPQLALSDLNGCVQVILQYCRDFSAQ